MRFAMRSKSLQFSDVGCSSKNVVKLLTVAAILISWLISSDALDRPKAASVAIIGAGVGGSTSAWFIREQLGPDVEIDIYEQAKVGGRTQVFNVSGEAFEMGASIIHEQNRYFRDLADRVGLERLKLGGDDSQISIYNGQRFVFNESPWTIVTLYRMLRRYGLSYLYMRQGPSEMLKRYLKLYDLQAEGQAFETPEALLKAVDLYNLTQKSFREALQDRIGRSGKAELFAKEFIAGINRIQYNQGNSINALAGMVSLLPTIDGRLFKIRGGNYQLAERLIAAAKATSLQGRTVRKVHKLADGSLELHSKSSSHGTETEAQRRYDAVIVATPLELTALKFSGFKVPHMPHRQYQTTVTTLLKGRLKAAYFGVQNLPGGDYVMVTEDADTPFSVIGPQKALLDGLSIYKLFSKSALDEATLQHIFSNLTVLHQREWKAYPHFDPPESFPPFKLTAGICLNNAWENAASAMEMSAVAAKNCALLTAAHLRGGQVQMGVSRGNASGDQAEL